MEKLIPASINKIAKLCLKENRNLKYTSRKEYHLRTPPPPPCGLPFWHVAANLGAVLRAKICKLPNI